MVLRLDMVKICFWNVAVEVIITDEVDVIWDFECAAGLEDVERVGVKLRTREFQDN